jgi:predicted chitinase
MSLTVTASQIKAIAGAGGANPRPDLVAAIVKGWPTAVVKAKLTNRNRACHFIAQIMTETGGLEILSESGAYRYEGIVKTFGVGHHSAKITNDEARQIAALPVAQRGPVLFDRVYGIGNPTKAKEFGHTKPGQGWIYRGGGMMQATGLKNYLALEKKTGLPLVAHPELLHNPDSAFMAAYLEWAQDGRCNAAADGDNVTTVRHIINGGENGLDRCKVFLAKAKRVLADYKADAPIAPFDPEPALAPAAPDAPVPAIVAADPNAAGDPELFSVQKRLKAMNYSAGIPSGAWGGMTAGALSGFLNDRNLRIPAPTSIEMFDDIRNQIKLELSRAEAEGFVRPVTDARANADAGTVAAVAPEVVPAKQNRTITIWGAICTFFAGLYQTFSNAISNTWNWLFGFYTDHKDNLPTDPSYLQTAWGYVTSIPTQVWVFAAAAGFVVLAVKAHGAVKKITESVQTGARQ